MSKYFRTNGVLSTSNTLGGIVRPSMVMNFDNGERLNPLFSCIRNSVGTYYDSLGILRTHSAGVPRIDHDPVTLLPKGLLVEESRTNLLTYSEQFDNAVWNKGTTGFTLTQNAAKSPDGTTTADLYTRGSTSSYAYLSQTISGNANQALTFSCWAQTLSGSSTVQLSISDVNLTTVSSSVISIDTNWKRISFSVSAGQLTNTGFIGVGFLMSAGQTAVFWGAQLESGAFATSYIPTVATQVTRNADLIKCTDTSWLHPSQGTLYAEATPFSTSTSNQPIFALTNSTSNVDNSIWLARSINNTVTDAGLSIRSGGTEQARLYQSASWPAGYKSRVAGSYKASELREASNAIYAETSGGVPQVSICYIGSVNESIFFNGHINHVAYYPSTSTRFELEYLTNSTWR